MFEERKTACKKGGRNKEVNWMKQMSKEKKKKSGSTKELGERYAGNRLEEISGGAFKGLIVIRGSADPGVAVTDEGRFSGLDGPAHVLGVFPASAVFVGLGFGGVGGSAVAGAHATAVRATLGLRQKKTG